MRETVSHGSSRTGFGADFQLVALSVGHGPCMMVMTILGRAEVLREVMILASTGGRSRMVSYLGATKAS